MDKTFFASQIDRLRKVYSPAALNDERVQLLWGQFRNLPNEIFEKAVNSVILESTTVAFPAASRFAEAAANARVSSDAGAGMDRLPDPYACARCRDHGFEFEEHTVIACKACYRGRQIGPKDLARHQASYDRGRKIYPTPEAMRRAFGAEMGGW